MPMSSPSGDVHKRIDTAVIRDDFLKTFTYRAFLGYIETNELSVLAAAPDFGETSLPLTSSMSRITVMKLSLANRSTAARPIPDAPPVTTDTLSIRAPFSVDWLFTTLPRSTARTRFRFLGCEFSELRVEPANPNWRAEAIHASCQAATAHIEFGRFSPRVETFSEGGWL